jgi:hypothetical protein
MDDRAGQPEMIGQKQSGMLRVDRSIPDSLTDSGAKKSERSTRCDAFTLKPLKEASQ